MSDSSMNQPRGETPGSAADRPLGTGSTADRPLATGSTATRPAASTHEADIHAHPDAAEMRARFDRVLEGPRATAVDGLAVLTGLYAAISPWVVHFNSSNNFLAVNNLIIGLAIAGLGIAMAARPARLLQLGWVLSALGIWLVVSPWVVSVAHHAPRGLIWNNAFVGGVAILLGLAAMGVLASGRHADGGRTRSRARRA